MIRVRHLTKSYGPLRAVDDVSFELDRGEVVGFLGPNGAGKSTTMRIITGYLHPDAGEVEVCGRSLARESLAARRAIGYLPETTALYRSMRVDDYLDWAARARGVARRERRNAVGRVRERCDLVGWGRRRIGELSKGYRQRVGLAQALVADPPVLVLDEPTSGLDPAEIVRIRELVADLGRERTVMISTHILAEVQETARRVVILAGGRVVADGDPHELAEAETGRVHVTLGGAPSGAPEALAALVPVASVRALGTDERGDAAFALEAPGRVEAVDAVFALAVERGWRLRELRGERPGLEELFLRRTQQAGAGTAPGSPAGGPATP